MVNLDDLTAPQPAPLFRPGGVSMHDVAAALHQRRKGHGLRKYASLLQAGNGRASGVDRLQESLDGLVYDLQVVCEQEAVTGALAEFRAWLVEREDAAGQTDTTVVLETYDALFSPVALAQRADMVAQRLIAQDWEERRAERA